MKILSLNSNKVSTLVNKKIESENENSANQIKDKVEINLSGAAGNDFLIPKSFLDGLKNNNTPQPDIQIEEKPEQNVVEKETPSSNSSEPKELNEKEMAARYTNDILLHLVASDVPCVLAILANVISLPSSLAAVVTMSNSLNLATTVVSAAADTRELVGSLKNPGATKMDKAVDLVHFFGCDVVGVATGIMPLVMSMANPIALGTFIGGQLLGVFMDIGKTIYDIKRKGQQSVYKPVEKPEEQKSVS